MAISIPREVTRRHGGGVGQFQELMRDQVRNILFVSTLYESFIMAEDGQLNELMLSTVVDVNLSQAPNLTRVSSGEEALALLGDNGDFDLIITSLRVQDMNALELVASVREGGYQLPVVALAYDHRELAEFVERHDTSPLERIFVWQGDARILLAMVKYVEDKLNVDHDARIGVPIFIVVEDSIRYYSSFLPLIYTEVMNLTQSVIAEGVNILQRTLRMRARPKILLATTYEEAWSYFSAYRYNVLGVISDINFPKHGEPYPQAGIELAKLFREARPDVPIALQSSNPKNEELARELGAEFFLKGSPVMLNHLRDYLTEHLFFGDFVFRMPDGEEMGRAHDLRTLVEQLHTVPAESIAYHAARNHFSSWLRARAEFDVAFKLRPRKLSEFPTLEHLRRDLIEVVDEQRRERNRSTIADFEPDTFYEAEGIVRIGQGSVGGKGRGLAFATRLVDQFRVSERFEDIDIVVPPAVVLGTDVFEEFLHGNELREVSIESDDDIDRESRFLEARFPWKVRQDLTRFLERVRYPIAVRSSSLLEDSPYQPLAGIFETWMLPNNHPDPRIRLEQLIIAVKRVYASTFSQHTKAYLKTTPYRLEEDQMAVIIQELVGARRGDLFYPDLAGVARSHNYYPIAPATSEDGIVAAALGLGRTVVEGEPCVRFSPAYPRHNVDFSTVEDMVRNSQREFWALRLGDSPLEAGWQSDGGLVRCPLDVAERDGVLPWLGSTYSPENQAVYDGVSREGVRLVSFAPILKGDLFPLAEIISEIMEMGSAGTGSPVEIEFAVRLSGRRDKPKQFGLLQLRPFAISRELEDVDVEAVDAAELICESDAVLGHGRVDEIHDVVVVDRDSFERSQSRECAEAVARFNATLLAAERPYLLIGVGRWGSTHSWLGIPVRWRDIAGARVIVEAGFKDFRVTPSQGTHFFQNLVSSRVGYFTVNSAIGEGFVAWDWLMEQPTAEEIGCVRHLTFDKPVRVTMNGKDNSGFVRKPAT